ncbi:uncharacterized protein LOC135071258 [Ostrinia nubilalis]|uniref:uncharacterized protein LOC135071258 n=1 Tax=Ostrinia nubilalis TaxID=29057 RepID=UPI0030826490
MNSIFFNFVFSLILFTLCKSAIVPRIPVNLQECYRGGGPPLMAPKRLDVYISLLRKLELSSRLDIKLFSTSLLRSIRLDGVEESQSGVETEFVLPFRAGDFQFHRYQILMDLFLPTQNLLEVDDILSLSEKCLLHRMMSSSVRQWERGDENIACPLSAQQRQNMATQSSGRIHSRCPIEEGVIQTDWGPIAPGILVAAVAASLEPQRVLMSDILNADIFKAGISEPLMVLAKQEWYEDIEAFNVEEQPAVPDISNVWVATLAGDLAEVVVNQGPRVGSVAHALGVGSSNRWNDTLLPRDFYLLPRNASNVDWHFTDAEMLAGVDGLILANFIPKWVEQRRTLRLSQILDMYYSHEGVSFDPSVKACNRQALFNQLFTGPMLLTEASRFARVLALRQITVYVAGDEMDRITEAAVAAFISYVPNVLSQNHLACHASISVPVIDMVVATDGAWKQYDVEQFMSWLGGALEINLQRSSLALLHGNTGEWIVPPCNNLTAVFDYLTNYTDPWPNRLNLPNIISRSIRISREKTLEEAELQVSAGPSTMMLIISPSDRPSGTELERATDLMHSLRTSFFDVYFVYAARDLTDFQNINNEYLDYSELFLATTSTSVASVIEAVDASVVRSVIPTRIFGPHCPFNGSSFDQVEYEDFVLPERKVIYRIHPFHLRLQPLINIQIRNDGQGALLVCSWRGADESHSCQTVPERETHVFNLTNPCPSADFCIPAYYTVAASTSGNICANDDCRLPHQVGYYIRHSGLRCLPLRGAANIVRIKFYFVLLVVIVFLIS